MATQVLEEDLDEAQYVLAKYYRMIAGNWCAIRDTNEPDHSAIEIIFRAKLLAFARDRLHDHAHVITEHDCALIDARARMNPKSPNFIDREAARDFLLRAALIFSDRGIPPHSIHASIDGFISKIHAEARVQKGRFA